MIRLSTSQRQIINCGKNGTPCRINKLKSLKVAQPKDDDGCGVVNACMNGCVSDVMCDAVCQIVCDIWCDVMFDVVCDVHESDLKSNHITRLVLSCSENRRIALLFLYSSDNLLRSNFEIA